MSDRSMPKRVTGLTRRKSSSNWQHEIRIPSELAHLHGGKRSYRTTLHTADRREAEVLATQLTAKWKTQFDDERRRLAGGERIAEVTSEMARQFAQQTLHDTLTNQQIRSSRADRRLVTRVLGIHGMEGMLGAADCKTSE